MNEREKRVQAIRAKRARATEVQTLLTKAFRILRSSRFRMVARQRFSCCNGCAGNELAIELRAKFKAGKVDSETFGGAVFYSNQHRLIEPGKSWVAPKVHDLYLHYGPVGIDGKDHGPKRKVCGDAVAEVLTELGIPFEWDGDPEQSIKITPLAQQS